SVSPTSFSMMSGVRASTCRISDLKLGLYRAIWSSTVFFQALRSSSVHGLPWIVDGTYCTNTLIQCLPAGVIVGSVIDGISRSRYGSFDHVPFFQSSYARSTCDSDSRKCMSPKRSGLSLPSAGNSGRPSSAMFNLPDEPRILKFFARLTNSGFKSFGSNNLVKVRLGSRFETTTFARYSLPLAQATPVTRLPLTSTRTTSASVTISPPKDLNALPSAFDTAPMPPRAKPHEPIDPSTSPM